MVVWRQTYSSPPAVVEKPITPEIPPNFRICIMAIESCSPNLRKLPQSAKCGICSLIKKKSVLSKVPVEEVENELDIVVIDKERTSLSSAIPLAYLNTLASVSAGNENAVAENQITSDHFGKIHILNPISEIYTLINEGKTSF